MAQTNPRARDLGLPFDGEPGPHNAISDVPGVAVGHATLIAGADVRTGATAILPRPRDALTVPVAAGFAALNGYGEMTAAALIREVGRVAGPFVLTSSNSIGVAHAAVLKWMVRRHGESAISDWGVPLIAETSDGWLHDIDGFHLTEAHVHAALDAAEAGAVAEGAVGGGTGMTCYGYKGGIGTASRRVGEHIVGVLLQANFGAAHELVIRGAPWARREPLHARDGDGSVIVIVATDAPLMPYQLARLARRVTLGIARTGTSGRHSSGDIFVAFSTANDEALAALPTAAGPLRWTFLPDALLNPIFQAVVEATEEAVLNALVAARTMTGFRGRTAEGIPHAEIQSLVRMTPVNMRSAPLGSTNST